MRLYPEAYHDASSFVQGEKASVNASAIRREKLAMSAHNLLRKAKLINVQEAQAQLPKLGVGSGLAKRQKWPPSGIVEWS